MSYLYYSISIYLGGEILQKKVISYRINPEIVMRISAWSLLLNKDKTQIVEESFSVWESSRPVSEQKSIETILDELKKKHQ